MQVEIIVATDSAGGFGKKGKIPWNCKVDMDRFKEISMDCGVCVMGKNTYVDMLEMRAKSEDAREKIKTNGILPGRTCYVVTSSLSEDDVIGAEVVPDLRAVFNKYFDTDQRIAVIGGEALYIQALSWASRVHVSVIPHLFDCDRFFPVNVLSSDYRPDPQHSRLEKGAQVIKGDEIITLDIAFMTYNRYR